ncbi:phage head closure protein [Conchiformibius kuhniae]|uniref:Phage head closure protein n=1 Tax=Conchiformibius kuhniae TaxID=211502 RepID=A0A8T9MUL8_9NEIS|nr:phage head closure protein [Conchiformibius kuhniae]UOP05337.1 phage head closure protein [Conchiformibius kuhniae]
MLHAGNLTCRIEIRHQTESEDAAGATVRNWAVFFRLWASIHHVRQTGGVESIQAGKLSESPHITVRVRFTERINHSMRVHYRGAVYNILTVQPDYLKREYTELLCEKTE